MNMKLPPKDAPSKTIRILRVLMTAFDKEERHGFGLRLRSSYWTAGALHIMIEVDGELFTISVQPQREE